MAYQTIRDLVAHVQSLHRRLREAVREAQTQVDDDRSALVLAVIDEHESALERAVEEVQKREGDAVLDTWLQFAPNAELDRALRRNESLSSLSRDEILAGVLETENALNRLYQLLSGSAGSPSVQSFFTSLMEMENSAARRAARVGLEAHDV